ncbi:FtsX-like permease family protein [Pengzhenrongella sicca]|uniref:ABC3 transporter permease C-terminal domain-containing protein n=1 Tax=Pengzhenrongella sicca TaxID=2819238 RepID=A0A8A4ZFC9_9MICO|nr:FtsX-like permease family protein [Pengzhenrongella sicca]QTE29246.1 hypothetical protein J4E96_18515 [Pengzhenrongella sicca]
MRTIRALLPLLRRAGGRDQRVTTGLAIAAFAVTTALTLSVIGGLLGFIDRAANPVGAYQELNATQYVGLAWAALVLLVVPLLTLGGAAARLGVARRDARLATLRLIGVTPREVVALTVLETSWQGLLGAFAGIVGYVALLPVWTRIPFEGATFTAADLWVGPGSLVLACVAVPLLAAVSGVVSLRRVVVSPLGVARRQSPRSLSWLRAAAAFAAIVVVVAVSSSLGAFGAAAIGVFVGALALGFATLNAVGPWTLGVLGRILLRRASTPAALLAARRLLDDPRATWRVVGGLGLAGFVAGALAVVPVMVALDDGADADTALLLGDLMRGAMVTLVLTYLVAAASAGITQAASVLDRRRDYVLQTLAGTPVELLDAVRRREVLVPLVVVSTGSALAALVMLFPLFGAAAVRAPQGLAVLAACLVAGTALVLGATETVRPLLRSVLADTAVRAD